VEALCAEGISAERAGWIVFAGMYYVLGHTIEEQAQSRLVGQDDDWRDRADRSPPDDPLFARALDSVIDADPADWFAYGLELFIDGIRPQLPSTRQRAHRRSSTPARARARPSSGGSGAQPPPGSGD
jgi:TetR/AcrR family tetracycline transcriptional repressor